MIASDNQPDKLKHRTAILEAKHDYLKTQLAVDEWRLKKPHINHGDFSENVLAKSSFSGNGYKICRSWMKDKTYSLLSALKEFDSQKRSTKRKNPPQKCQSEIYFESLKPETVNAEGITIGELFNGASKYVQKNPATAVANIMNCTIMSPQLFQDVKYYTTPITSQSNSPRKKITWTSPKPEVNESTPKSEVDESTPKPNLKQPRESPKHNYCYQESLPHSDMKCDLETMSPFGTDEDMDNIQCLPYAHRRCGTVEVLPTITETSPRSVSVESFFRSLGSTPLSFADDYFQGRDLCTGLSLNSRQSRASHKSKCDWQNIARPSPMLSRCSLCDKYGMSDTLIFSADNLHLPCSTQDEDGSRNSKIDYKVKSEFLPIKSNLTFRTKHLNVPQSKGIYHFLPPIEITENTRTKKIKSCPRPLGKRYLTPAQRLKMEATKSCNVESFEVKYARDKRLADEEREKMNAWYKDGISRTLPSLPPLIPTCRSSTQDTSRSNAYKCRRHIDDSIGILRGRKSEMTLPPKKKTAKRTIAENKMAPSVFKNKYSTTAVIRYASSREVQLHIKLPSACTPIPEPYSKKKKYKKKKLI